MNDGIMCYKGFLIDYSMLIINDCTLYKLFVELNKCIGGTFQSYNNCTIIMFTNSVNINGYLVYKWLHGTCSFVFKSNRNFQSIQLLCTRDS